MLMEFGSSFTLRLDNGRSVDLDRRFVKKESVMGAHSNYEMTPDKR